MFINKSFLDKRKAKRYGLVEDNVLKEKTLYVIEDLNTTYKREYNTTFTKQVKRCLNLPSYLKLAKRYKADIENQWEKTCVEKYDNR